jgi:hypothetical protein
MDNPYFRPAVHKETMPHDHAHMALAVLIVIGASSPPFSHTQAERAISRPAASIPS